MNAFFCYLAVNCTADQFKCGSTSKCVEKSKVCDRNSDCPDGEDEQQNCGMLHVVVCVPIKMQATGNKYFCGKFFPHWKMIFSRLCQWALLQNCDKVCFNLIFLCTSV